MKNPPILIRRTRDPYGWMGEHVSTPSHLSGTHLQLLRGSISVLTLRGRFTYTKPYSRV